MLYHQPILYHADRRPKNIAITAHDYTWNYQSLVNAGHAVARFLLRENVQQGERIGILGLNSAAHGAIMIGASLIGAVAVPVNFRLAPAELAFIFDDSNIRLLFATDDMLFESIDATVAIRELPTAIVSNRATDPHSLTTILEDTTGDKVTTQCWDEDAPVLQLYTSGTTGKPKGAELTHRNMASLVTMMSLTNDGQYTSKNVDLIVAPLFHIGGSGVLFIVMATGGHAVTRPSFDPVETVEIIQREKINTAFFVPAMIQAMVKLVPNIEQYDLSSMKHIAYGAAPISASLLEEALGVFKCDFSQVYGMTETTGTVISLPPEAHVRALNGEEHLLKSCGKPCAGNEVKIIDDDGNTLGPNQTGEICLRSASNMRGYLNRPEATEKTIVDGWVHSGDAGYLDEEGFLFLRDRLKDMVVSGGENIYPVEVENVLAGLPGVIEVAVIGVPDEKFGEALLAFFALKPGFELNADTMIDYCRDKLAGYKIPRKLELVDALPRNPSGKVLKTVLREPYWAGHDRRIG